jgi:ribonuclease/clavin/mitogillin
MEDLLLAMWVLRAVYFVCFLVLLRTLLRLPWTRSLFSQQIAALYVFLKTHPTFQSLSRLFLGNQVPRNLPHVSSVEKVSSRVYRILGQNPGYHTLQGTNTFLVTGNGSSDAHVLIDTGEASTSEAYLKVLFDEVFPLTKTRRLRAILLTHGHGDHQGGVVRIMQELQRRQMTPLPTIYKKAIPSGKYPCVGFEAHDIAPNQVFEVDSETRIVALESPGHTDDHIAFILPEDEALFSGDCVLGCGTSVFDDLYEYMRSLEKIRALIVGDQQQLGHIKNIYPGHGPVIRETALAKIDEYISHRSLRETQIIQVLTEQQIKASSDSESWLTSLELVTLVYGKLPLGVYFSAQANLLHHLQKLFREGKVYTAHHDLWRLADDSQKKMD